MKNQIKAKGLHFLFFLFIYMCLYFPLLYFIDSINRAYITGITAFLTVMISPRLKVIKAQSRDKIQITWIFQKKAQIF
ncbi:hypothetical protein [Ancylomarina euxinus]|nr:hypothetical protein [Ancylomarina euxinus]MCZ4695307.1 hypothetical protein [Ancylomarina euxinus]MUP15502.1 hypothetical protein [Ancylomarina euxinus]